MSTLYPKPMSEDIRDLLKRKMRFAIANLKYDGAIKFAEKYRRLFMFDDNLLYELGLLYDHEANIAAKTNQKRTGQYLEKARSIYANLIKRNPKNFFALFGMARVYANKKEYQRAIHYAKRAYREKNKLPIGQKGALSVGSFYVWSGDFKGAERWYKKELKDLGGDEFGAFMNLLIFYNRIRKREKAYSLAFKAEKLMEKEFEKSVYKNLPVLKSKAMKIWKAEIQKARNWKPDKK